MNTKRASKMLEAGGALGAIFILIKHLQDKVLVEDGEVSSELRACLDRAYSDLFPLHNHVWLYYRNEQDFKETL